MPNPINPRPLEPLLAELQGLGLSNAAIVGFREMFTRMDKVLTNLGEVQAVAPVKGRTEGLGTTVAGLANTGDILAVTKVVGRTEGLGTTVGQLNSSGQLVSTDQIAADGTGSPLTGGKRAAVALDINNRLAGSFRANVVNVASTPTSASGLANNGIATAVTVSAQSQQFGDGTVAYNSGSIDPGSFTGPVYVYADDPTFSGGPVAYQFTVSVPDQTAANGRTVFGSITTAPGSSRTGGGFTGGSAGGVGGRGFIHN